MSSVSVFFSYENGDGPATNDPIWVRKRILKAASSQEWVSTSQLYRACNRNVTRVMLHTVLSQMLEAKELTMRVIERKTGGRPSTQFKIAVKTVSATPSVPSEQ